MPVFADLGFHGDHSAFQLLGQLARGKPRLKFLVRGCALLNARGIDCLCVRGGSQLARQEKITRVAIRYVHDLALFACSLNILFQ